ncbi:MAG: NIPSNAP family protein [Candidatus Eremiobacteraeota bacterium]|nr:NIPSNAP family protein [Candidatus Eremiobacteraeota bacterium]
MSTHAFVEMRTYTLVPGKTAAYFALYEREGLAVQREHLGEMFGYYATEIGHANTVVHMWRYDSWDDRIRRRTGLKDDPRWQAYLAQMLPLLVDQDVKILLPAPFFTLPAR